MSLEYGWTQARQGGLRGERYGIDYSFPRREHFIEGRRGQDFIRHVQELLGETALQTRYYLVQIQVLVVVDEAVAHVAENPVAVEEVIEF